MRAMHWPALITLLTLLLLFLNAFLVGRARGKYGVHAPATSGHEMFDRAYRVQMNTLENTVAFLPALWLFAFYVDSWWSAMLGAGWIVGRVLYAGAYLADPRKRGPGFVISMTCWSALVVGSFVGLLRQLP